MKTYKKNIIFTVILSIILSFGIQQDSAFAQGMKEVPVYTIWAVDDKGGDLYYYTLNENYDNPDNMTPTLEGKIEGIEGTKDIEAFAIDSDGVMWLMNNHKSQTPRESTLYKIDPDQVDGDPNTPVTAVKIGPTGLRAESNNELTNLQFINADGQTDLYGITKRNKKIYKIDIQTGKAGFVATVNTGRTGFRRTDALTQGADGVVYLIETDQDKIYKFESFPGGKLIEVAEINGADKIEALTAHPNGFLYAGDGKSWYKIWPDEPDNNMPTWEKELDFSFGTEGMDFWFETEKVKLDDDDFTDPLADGVILFTNSLGSLDDVANQDGNNIDTQTVTKWLGTAQNAGDSYLGLRFHNFPTYDLKVISAKLQITNNRRNQWITSSGDVFAEKSENPGIFSQDTLPSDRVLTSAYGTYDKDERWNLGQVLSIDVTEPMQELVAEGLAGETVALVVKGTGKRWARLLFNYDNLDVVKLVVVVRDTEPDPDADSDDDGLLDTLEDSTCTDPDDADTDDDGIPDGTEDANQNGIVDADETDPCDIDTDGDGIQDGTESGYTVENIGHDTDIGAFQPDLDPTTKTDPLNSNTDSDSLTDGQEDVNHNGLKDEGERNPSSDFLVVDFGSSQGLFGYDENDLWTPLNDNDPDAVIAADFDGNGQDELAVSFAGMGLYIWNEINGWSKINDTVPEKMIEFNGGLMVDFGSGWGLFRYDEENGWTTLNNNDPYDMVAADIDTDGQDELAVSFAASGLHIWDETDGWSKINDDIPEQMIAYNNGLAIDFGSEWGLFRYDENNMNPNDPTSPWTPLNTNDPHEIVAADIDSDGDDELAVSFAGWGLYIWDEVEWSRINNEMPEGMIAFDNGLAVDFGSPWGLFRYNENKLNPNSPNGFWTPLNSNDPGYMVAADIDKDGQDELAVGFAGWGLYIWDEFKWSPINNNAVPEEIIAVDLN
ncbi:MAG: hypothetical protein GY795_13435 [Desulfobacterales bacterium]|nr:hypothetical protein [Desulfobacterales bacterium]